MSEKPKPGLRNVILVWVIGLTLGIGAGAATAMLLMPSQEPGALHAPSLGDKLRSEG
jgi:hypothetical protein